MMLVWNVKYFDCNAQVIRDYNVLKYRLDLIKKLKKKCGTREAFSDELEHEFRWQYWSRSEYELIIEIVGNRVTLLPWSGCREPMKAALDVTDDDTFDWQGFAEYHFDKQIYKDQAKFCIFEQLRWRWDELVDYCWYTRLPYERKHPKFER